MLEHMPKSRPVLDHVRAFLASHGGRGRLSTERWEALRFQVSSYVRALESTMTGVETHAETMRQLRDQATTALLELEDASRLGRDVRTERYVVAAYLYLRALEAAMTGEGAGREELEQYRLDYETAKRQSS